MKAVQIVKPNQLEVIDIEKPVIDPKNNVLVKMTAAGICGSDAVSYTHLDKPVQFLIFHFVCDQGIT